MKSSIRTTAAGLVVTLAMVSLGRAASILPLSTFGGGDGWRGPYETVAGDVAGTSVPDPTDPINGPARYRYMGYGVTGDALLAVNPGNLERGLAFNAATNHLLLTSRNSAPTGNPSTPSIRILDATTGADLGALNQGSGIVTGGTFPFNMVGIAEDGAIYAANLTTSTTAAPFKIYRWANESATPTVAFSGQPGTLLTGARLGDTFDVIGSGATTRLIAGYSNNPAVTGNNGVALFTANDGVGLSFSAANMTMAADVGQAVPSAGEFRLGLTFKDSDTFIGKSTVNAAQVADIVGTTATVTANFSTDGITLRPMDFAVVGGKPLLAIVEASPDQNDTARARLFVYDITDPSVPLAMRKIGEASTLPDPGVGVSPKQFANINATGQVKFGAINDNVATIYAMSSNNGIEAFTLTLDLPPAPDANFNDDAFVDAADLSIWSTGFGGAGTATTGDANNDGTVDGADFLAWQQQFNGTVAVAAGNAVPEPAAAALGLASLAGLVMLRRRGR